MDTMEVLMTSSELILLVFNYVPIMGLTALVNTHLRTSEGFLSRSECKSVLGLLVRGSILVLHIMVELAFYPAVALMYFFGVMKATQDDRVELNDGASMNVFCLFVLAQPLCLVIGGYAGMATYLVTALVSYNFLPWRQTKQPAKEKELKKKKTK